jgi:hypothetical protein
VVGKRKRTQIAAQRKLQRVDSEDPESDLSFADAISEQRDFLQALFGAPQDGWEEEDDGSDSVQEGEPITEAYNGTTIEFDNFTEETEAHKQFALWYFCDRDIKREQVASSETEVEEGGSPGAESNCPRCRRGRGRCQQRGVDGHLPLK